MLPFKDEINNIETLKNYLGHSDIDYLSKGSYGLTLRSNLVLNLPPDSNWTVGFSRSTGHHFYQNMLDLGSRGSTYNIPNELKNNPAYIPFPNYYKKISPDKEFGSPVYELVIKLCLINDDPDAEVKNVISGEIHSVSAEEFQNEINVQTDVYLKTIKYLQPLAPGIVYANIIDKLDESKLLLITLSNNSGNDNVLKQGLSNIYFKLNMDPSSKLGVIVMELAFGDTLGKIEDFYMKRREIEIARALNNVGRYALLQLALETGYNQNDFHKYNIMLIPCRNYFEKSEFSARGMIIDYGRAAKIPNNILEQIRNLVNEKKYTDALKLLCDKSYAYPMIPAIKYAKRNYGWVCGDYNLSDADYEEEIMKLFDEATAARNTYNATHVPPKPAVTIDEVKSIVPKPLELNDINNVQLGELFEDREIQLNKNIEIMKQLHNSNPDKYPLLPVSNEIKNKLFSGMIGGKKKKYTRRNKRNKF